MKATVPAIAIIGRVGSPDLTNPANPFKDWNVVYVPYYGALFHGPLLHDVWPAASFRVLGDAGNGVITTDFLHNEFPHWNVISNLPKQPAGIIESITGDSGMVGYPEAVAAYYPATKWANYTAAFDGGAMGQTGFFNLMAHNNDLSAAMTWWTGSCRFNRTMQQQAIDVAAAVTAAGTDNYRYYIGSGSRHTMWGSDKVYTDTFGGVPLLVDWINAMLGPSDDPAWVNVEASPENVLLLGDPAPNPLAEPFETSGADIIVNCQ